MTVKTHFMGGWKQSFSVVLAQLEQDYRGKIHSGEEKSEELCSHVLRRGRHLKYLSSIDAHDPTSTPQPHPPPKCTWDCLRISVAQGKPRAAGQDLAKG